MASRAASITSQLSCHALGSSCSLCRSGGADFCVRLNVLKPALPRAESQNEPPSPLCVCVCFSAGLRALISGAEIWQSQQVMTEAVVRSHPEPQRRLTFQARFNTQDTNAPIGGARWCHCSLDRIVQPTRAKTTFFFFLFFFFFSLAQGWSVRHL